MQNNSDNGEDQEYYEQEDAIVRASKELGKKAGKKVVDKAAEAAKEAVKKAAKVVMKKIIALLTSKVGLIIIGIIIAIVIVCSVVDYIINIEDGKESKDKSNVPYVVGSFLNGRSDETFDVNVDGQIYTYQFGGIQIVGEEGNYSWGFLKPDGTMYENLNSAISENIISLINGSSDVLDRYIPKDRQVEVLTKMINADIVNTYIKLGENGLQGAITIARNESSAKLVYTSKDNFYNMYNAGDPNVLNYFTLENNESTGKLGIRVAKPKSGGVNVYKETTMIGETVANVRYVNSTTAQIMTEEEYNSALAGVTAEGLELSEVMDYNSTISGVDIFSLPFDYLWAILVLTGDVDFVEELADLAISSDIVITIFDEETVNKTITKEQYTVNTTQTLHDGTFTFKTVNGTREVTLNLPDGEVRKSKDILVETTNINLNKTLGVELTKADTWLIKHSKDSRLVDDLGEDISFDSIQTSPLEDEEEVENQKYEYEGVDVAAYLETLKVARGLFPISFSAPDHYYELELEKGKVDTSYTQNIKMVNHVFGTSSSIISSKKRSNDITSGYEEKAEVINKLSDVKYEQTYKTLKNSIGWLTEMLEENEDANFMVDVTDYLIKKVENPETASIVGDYIDENSFNLDGFNLTKNNKSYWWPVGSAETTTVTGEDGKTRIFAAGEPVDSYITSKYGQRWGTLHAGIDISSKAVPTNIVAVKDGVVEFVQSGTKYENPEGNVRKFSGNASYGNFIIIKHTDSNDNVVYTYYAHLKTDSITVAVGDVVEQGQLIGIMGSTGNSSGAHLHFEMRVGGKTKNNTVDPEIHVSSENPRPTMKEGREELVKWIKSVEGGSKHINGEVWEIFSGGSDDPTMNLSYGMVVASYSGGDSWYPDLIPGKIYEGDTVTEAIASKIMEIKYKSFDDIIDKACYKYGVTLEYYERDAVFSMIYRLGASRADQIIGAYVNGSYEGLWNFMKDRYNYKFQVGTKIRLAEEFELFCNGDYEYDPGTYSYAQKYDTYCKDYTAVFK